MITRKQVVGVLFVLYGLGLCVIVALMYRGWGPVPVPTHIEADNLRYLDPAVGCEVDGVTWAPRADGGCYIADKPHGIAAQEAGAMTYDGKRWVPTPLDQLARECLQYDKEGNLTPIPNCIVQRTPAGDCEVSDSSGHKHIGPCSANAPAAQPSLPSTPPCGGSVPCNQVLAAQPSVVCDGQVHNGVGCGDSGMESGTASLGVVNGIPSAQPCEMYDSSGNAHAVPCGPSPDPGPLQGKWMAERGDHCTINGYTDVLCDNPCDTTGISLKEWETYSCTVDGGNGHISSGTLPTISGDGCHIVGDVITCDKLAPPAVLAVPLKGPCAPFPEPFAGYVCDLDNPNADYVYVPPAYDECTWLTDQAHDGFICQPIPDDNSEELEQDDYNNEITEGSQI